MGPDLCGASLRMLIKYRFYQEGHDLCHKLYYLAGVRTLCPLDRHRMSTQWTTFSESCFFQRESRIERVASSNNDSVLTQHLPARNLEVDEVEWGQSVRGTVRQGRVWPTV